MDADFGVPTVVCTLMGTWINGGSSKDVLWMLHIGMPCYVIHELDLYKEFHLAAHDHNKMPSFLVGMPVQDATKDHILDDNAWEQRVGPL